MLKVNNRNTRKSYETCPKLTIKVEENTESPGSFWCFQEIQKSSLWCLYSYFRIYCTHFLSISIAGFEQVSDCWKLE